MTLQGHPMSLASIESACVWLPMVLSRNLCPILPRFRDIRAFCDPQFPPCPRRTSRTRRVRLSYHPWCWTQTCHLPCSRLSCRASTLGSRAHTVGEETSHCSAISSCPPPVASFCSVSHTVTRSRMSECGFSAMSGKVYCKLWYFHEICYKWST